MGMMKSVLFYVKKDCINSKKQLDEIVSRLDTTYEDYVEDGEEYYRFTVKRPNHFSMSNGTAMKIDLSADESVDDYVDWINELVDNII